MTFEQIYECYADSVYAYLKFKLGNDQVVEDLMQETFLALYQRPPDSIDSYKAWLLRIAHHKMVDWLRKKQLVSDSLPELSSLDPALESTADNLLVYEALSTLDEDTRTIIYGLYVENLRCKELAVMLNLPEGTIKSKAYYGRQKLRSWLGQEV